MIVERITFQAKYGQGDALVDLFREWGKKFAARTGATAARVYTDATGAMFTVQADQEYPDMAAYAAATATRSEVFGTPEFAELFSRMQAVTERGERQLLNAEEIAIG